MSRDAERTNIEPFFLEGSAGRLFGIHHSPGKAGRLQGTILCIPAFAEEQNKVRRQVALQARAFAARGFAVLELDLFGTGDSDGDFAQARWDIWCNDLLLGAQWLERRHGHGLVLWAVRLGALLAVDLLEALAAPPVHMLMWQPVVSGRAHMNQFLRLVVAAEMISGKGRATTREMLAELEQGRSIEVAGYELHPDLFAAISRRNLADEPCGPLPPVSWHETVAEDGRPVAAASRRVIDAWLAAGAQVRADTVVGEPYWTTTEIAVVPELIGRSCESLMNRPMTDE